MANYPSMTVIVGSGRSGTTYLQRALRKTMDLSFYGEPRFVMPVYRLSRRLGDLSNRSNLVRVARAIHSDRIFWYLSTHREIDTSPDEILERLQEPTLTGILYAAFQLIADKLEKGRLAYKNPGDVMNIPLLARILPTARFVHIIRDGRDVAHSVSKCRWGPNNLYAGANLWAERTKRGREGGDLIADRYFEVRFEDLLLDTDHVGLALGEFIDEKDDPESVEYFVEVLNETKRPDRASSWLRALDEEQRYLCEAAAGEVLRACGYPLEFDDAQISPLKAQYYLVSSRLGQMLNRLTVFLSGGWRALE